MVEICFENTPESKVGERIAKRDEITYLKWGKGCIQGNCVGHCGTVFLLRVDDWARTSRHEITLISHELQPRILF